MSFFLDPKLLMDREMAAITSAPVVKVFPSWRSMIMCMLFLSSV